MFILGNQKIKYIYFKSFILISEFGLLYFGQGKNIDSKVYPSGRYFIGPTNKFIKFSSENLIAYDYTGNNTVKIFTSNLQPIDMDLQIFLKIDPNYASAQLNSTITYNLVKFYFDYGSEWQSYFNSLIKATIQSLSVNYDTTFFFENRKIFKNLLFDKINSVVKTKSNKIINIYSLQLQQIKLNPIIEKSINNKLVQYQKIKLYSINDQIFTINKNTDRMKKQNLADIDFITMNAKSYYESSKIYIHSNCTDTIMKNDISIYSELDSSLFLSFEGNLLNFISVLEGKDYTPNKFVNFNSLSLAEQGQ